MDIVHGRYVALGVCLSNMRVYLRVTVDVVDITELFNVTILFFCLTWIIWCFAWVWSFKKWALDNGESFIEHWNSHVLLSIALFLMFFVAPLLAVKLPLAVFCKFSFVFCLRSRVLTFMSTIRCSLFPNAVRSQCALFSANVYARRNGFCNVTVEIYCLLYISKASGSLWPDL